MSATEQNEEKQTCTYCNQELNRIPRFTDCGDYVIVDYLCACCYEVQPLY